MDRVGHTIVNRRSTPGADAARELLTRNEVPHRWVDIDRDPLAPLLETESRSLHAWSNPGEERSVAHIELRPGSPGFENALRIVYGLAADGLVWGNGVPRNPLHAALVLEMGEVRLPGAYAAIERVLRLVARIARWRGVDRELERRYL